LLSAGDPDGAISAYQAAIQAPRLSDTTSVEIKVGQAYASKKDYNNAIRTYMSIYQTSNSDYDKAEMDFLTGQIYLDINQPEQAYARFQDPLQIIQNPTILIPVWLSWSKTAFRSTT